MITFRIEVIFISNYTDDRDDREIVRTLLNYMKKNNISNKNKEIIYNMVLEITYKTDLQKERFIRYYGLKLQDFQRETLTEIARSSNINPSAVRSSVVRIRHALIHISEDNFLKLKQIYEDEFQG